MSAAQDVNDHAEPAPFGVSPLVGLVAELEVVDVAGLDLGGVRAGLSGLATVKGWHDGLHVRLSRRLRDLSKVSPSICPEADIAAAAKTSQREATQAAKRADTLDAVPQLEDALANGDVSPEHVDSLGRALKRLKPDQREQLAGNGDRLAEIAKASTPEEFDKHLSTEIARLDRHEGGERLARQRRAARFRSWTDRDTGMLCFRGELDPETGLKVISRIESTVEAMFHTAVPQDCPQGDGKQDYLRAQALTRLVLRRNPTTRAGQPADHTDNDGRADALIDVDTEPDTAGTVEAPTPAPRSSRPVAPAPEYCTNNTDDGDGLDITTLDNRCDMIVVIDLNTLINGLHEHSIITNGHNLDLPIETYRRLACQAAIIPAVLDGNGVCVDLGQTVRLANRAQRRALYAMYDTCAIPGCTVSSRHCQPHHVIWSTRLGPTDLGNLVPLCSKHHHSVHEGGWQVTIHPNRSLTITYPNGQTHITDPPAYQRKQKRRTA